MGGRGGRAFKTDDMRKSEAFFGVYRASGMYHEWIDKLSYDESKAVRRYTGHEYRDINGALRGPDLSRASADIRDCIDHITSGLAKFGLKKSITVYRGAESDIFGGFKTAKEINAMAKAGARLVDKGFMSTSAAEGDQFGGRYRFIITVPAGTGRGAYVAPMSHFNSENEFLLQRGTSFKINKAVDHGQIIDVYLRVETKKKKK